MKKIIYGLTLLSLVGWLAPANAQPVASDPGTNENGAVEQPSLGQSNAPDEDEPPPGDMAPDGEPPAAGNVTGQKVAHAPVVTLPGPAKPATGAVQSDFMPPTNPVGTNNPDALRMNFRNAPLDMVLNYLSDAAGFIIVLDTQVSGDFSVISDQPMTRDEAVNLLNSVLNQNGYAAIRNGRTLTIMDKSTAKTHDIPVRIGNDPDAVPDNAEIVTQIIPIRFVDAGQLVTDLTPFVSPQATIVANAEGNSIVITDTQANIRHLMKIIQAVDNGAESETVIHVFRLKYANPTDVATELGSIFPSSTSTSNSQDPRRQFFARMMGRGGNSPSTDSGSKGRIAAATQVTAVADSRIQAVIVTAQKDLMGQIASMMTNLDVPSARDQQVFVFHLNNADPQQAAQVLQNMFQTGNTSRGGGSSSSSTQNSALMQRAQNNATSTTSGTSGSSSSGFRSGSGQRSGGPQF